MSDSQAERIFRAGTGRREHALEATKAHLGKMSLLFIHLMNTRDFNGMLQADWIDPSFVAATDYLGREEYVNLTTHVSRFRQHVEEFPNYLISHAAAQVELRGDTASVFVNGDQSGYLSGLKMPGVGMFAWRCVREKRDWLLCRVVALRSSVSSSRSMDPF